MELFASFMFVVWVLALYYAPGYYGYYHLKKGNYRKALRAYQCIQPIYRYSGKEAEARICFCIGNCFMWLGELEQSIAHFQVSRELWEQCSRRYKYDYITLSNSISATLYARLGDRKRAETHLEFASFTLRYNSKLLPDMLTWRAYALLYLEDFEESETLCKRVLATSGLDTSKKVITSHILASAYYCQKRFAEALEIYQLIEQTPNCPLDYLVAAYCGQVVTAVELDNLALAQQAESKLLPLLPRLEATLQNGAYKAVTTLALAQGDLERALDYAERAYNEATTRREQATSLYLQACVYAKRENPTRALQLLKEAETYPNFTLFKDRIVKLRQEVEAKYHS